jgi:spermidine synthase
VTATPGTEELLDETIEDGARLRLVRRVGLLEIWRDDVLWFGEQRRRQDRDFAEFALAPLGGRDDLSIVLAGLGTGLLLRAILDVPGVREVEVIERSPSIARWAGAQFSTLNGGALADPRVTLTIADLGARLSGPEPLQGRFGLVLDLDASLASATSNAGLYDDVGVALLASALRAGGAVALASQQREPELLRRLSARMQNVAEVAAPVDSEPGALDYFYRARKPAARVVAPTTAN